MSDVSDTEVDATTLGLRAKVAQLRQRVQTLEEIQDKYNALKNTKNNLDKSLAPLLEDMRAADPTLQVTRVGSEFIKNFGAFYANLKAKTANIETAAEIESLRQEVRKAQQNTTQAQQDTAQAQQDTAAAHQAWAQLRVLVIPELVYLFLEARKQHDTMLNTREQLQTSTGPTVWQNFFGEQIPDMVRGLGDSLQAVPRFDQFYQQLTEMFIDDSVLVACHLHKHHLSPEQLSSAVLDRLNLLDMHRRVPPKSPFHLTNTAAYLEANIMARPEVQDWSKLHLNYGLDISKIPHIRGVVSAPDTAQSAQHVSQSAGPSTQRQVMQQAQTPQQPLQPPQVVPSPKTSHVATPTREGTSDVEVAQNVGGRAGLLRRKSLAEVLVKKEDKRLENATPTPEPEETGKRKRPTTTNKALLKLRERIWDFPARATKDGSGAVVNNWGGNVDYTSIKTALGDLKGIGKKWNLPDFIVPLDRMAKSSVRRDGPMWLCVRDSNKHPDQVIGNAWTRSTCGLCKSNRTSGMTVITTSVLKGTPDYAVFDLPENEEPERAKRRC
jgi:hypothetical protein